MMHSQNSKPCETLTIKSENMKIKIIKQKANHEDSMRILKENGLEPLTYQEALANGAELVKLAKGNWIWFYLAGKGTDKSGYHTIDKDGEVRAGRGEVEDTVYIWKGKNPLSLDVHSDSDSAQSGRRFVLLAGLEPGDVAPVVVGKPLGKVSSKDKHKHRFVCECGKVKS